VVLKSINHNKDISIPLKSLNNNNSNSGAYAIASSTTVLYLTQPKSSSEKKESSKQNIQNNNFEILSTLSSYSSTALANAAKVILPNNNQKELKMPSNFGAELTNIMMLTNNRVVRRIFF
jgi:hypothetical protein